MRRVLHIFDSQDAPYDPEMVQEQKKLPGCDAELFDLNQPGPDYDALLDKIFSADCVEVW
jgi:hypothetical protein